MGKIVLKCNNNQLYSFSSGWFPKVNIGETLQFEEAYPETTVQRGMYIVDNIKHVFTKISKGMHGSSDVTTIIELKIYD